MKIKRHKSYNKNAKGRDLIVGDIHGCFDLLTQALKAVNFIPEDDRLFAVGDLVNRGPQCAQAATWLNYSWFHSVMGNHDSMMLNSSAKAIKDRKPWLQAMSLADIKRLESQCAKLPLTIDVETSIGRVGIVHAEVAQFTDWHTFTSQISDPKSDYNECALWDSERLTENDKSGVPDISRVFSGHVVQEHSPKRLGNVYYIDTGAYRRVLDPSLTMFGLTLTSLAADHKTIMAPKKMPANGISIRL